MSEQIAESKHMRYVTKLYRTYLESCEKPIIQVEKTERETREG